MFPFAKIDSRVKDKSSLAKTYSLLEIQNFVLSLKHGFSFTILLGFYRFRGNKTFAIFGEKE